MLTKIVYNCNPESLDTVDQSAFVDAFEAEVRAIPRYVDLDIEVTFRAGRSRLVSFSSDAEMTYTEENALADEFAYIAEKAFNKYLADIDAPASPE